MFRGGRGRKDGVAPLGLLLMLQFMLFIFVVNVEKNHAAFVYFLAKTASVGEFAAGFAALFAPVIDQSVVPASDVLFQATMMDAMHPAIRRRRVFQQTMNGFADAQIAMGIGLADPVHLGRKSGGRKIFKEIVIIHVRLSRSPTADAV